MAISLLRRQTASDALNRGALEHLARLLEAREDWESLAHAVERLAGLAQTDSQRILAGLEADVAAAARRALTASLDDLGSATFRADLASLRHETQYTRLFRS